MAAAAKISDMKNAFSKHQEQTHEHLARVERVFQIVGEAPDAKTCEAINGTIAEGEHMIKSFGATSAIDTGLIAAAEAVEHYEMARYGALAAWAKQLQLPEAGALLNQTMQEEQETNQLLTKLGAREADKKAA